MLKIFCVEAANDQFFTTVWFKYLDDHELKGNN